MLNAFKDALQKNEVVGLTVANDLLASDAELNFLHGLINADSEIDFLLNLINEQEYEKFAFHAQRYCLDNDINPKFPEDMEALQTVCDLQYPFRQILRNDPLDLHKAARTASHCSSVDCHNTLRCFPVDFRSRMASPADFPAVVLPANSDFPVFLYVSWLHIWCRTHCHPAFHCRTSDISYKIPPLRLK